MADCLVLEVRCGKADTQLTTPIADGRDSEPDTQKQPLDYVCLDHPAAIASISINQSFESVSTTIAVVGIRCSPSAANRAVALASA